MERQDARVEALQRWQEEARSSVELLRRIAEAMDLNRRADLNSTATWRDAAMRLQGFEPEVLARIRQWEQAQRHCGADLDVMLGRFTRPNVRKCP